MWDKAKQALPATGLLAGAALFAVLPTAAFFRLSVRLLEKACRPLPPRSPSLRQPDMA
jgi:hypothetical protein